MKVDSAKRLLTAILEFSILAIVFGIAYTQDPLYSENQHTKFLHGLAQAGLGYLKEDWQANTLDPLPVFSYLIKVTYIHLGENAFYFYYIILFGIYIYSLLGIVSYLFKVRKPLPKYLAFLAAFIALHCIKINIFGIKANILLHYGLAEQYILGPRFQPSSFGVLIILSIYLFLQKKSRLAILSLVIASIFHLAYLPSVVMLAIAYMVIIYREQGDLREAWAIGNLAFISVMPILIYLLIVFSPTSLETWQHAQSIIVNFRIPHHSLPEVWLSKNKVTTCIQLLIIVAALYMARATRLFWIYMLPLSMVVVLTLWQVIFNTGVIGFTAPWRISAVYVPISTSIILAYLSSHVFDKYWYLLHHYRQFLSGLFLTFIFLLVVKGVLTQIEKFEDEVKESELPMMNFVRDSKQSGEIYLVPLNVDKIWKVQEFWKFRLYTGAPIFVNMKSHPYKDVEVIEWYNRVLIAQRFYENQSSSCAVLNELKDQYQITHVVLREEYFDIGCQNLAELFKDEEYAVYKIVRQ